MLTDTYLKPNPNPYEILVEEPLMTSSAGVSR